MSFRKILVPLADVDGDAAAIDVALQIGRQFRAQIVAIYARMVSSNPTDETGVARARSLFQNCCASHHINLLGDTMTEGLSGKFLELRGIEAGLIAQHGRVSDLIVFAYPNSCELGWPNISVQTALRETARPVLLAPGAIMPVGKRNIIAWNGPLEAARAVAFAMPLLLRSADTLVVTVGNHDIQPSGEKLVDYLMPKLRPWRAPMPTSTGAICSRRLRAASTQAGRCPSK